MAPNSKVEGIPLSWPEGISRDQEISDRLIITLTTGSVDLGHFTSGPDRQTSRGPDSTKPSLLELLAFEIQSGSSRDVG